MRAEALVAAADLTMALIDDDRAEPLYQESQALYRELGDIRGIALTLQGLAGIAQRKDVAMRRSLLEESLALYREISTGQPLCRVWQSPFANASAFFCHRWNLLATNLPLLQLAPNSVNKPSPTLGLRDAQ
jgi:hypothetical protein